MNDWKDLKINDCMTFLVVYVDLNIFQKLKLTSWQKMNILMICPSDWRRKLSIADK